MADGPLTVLDVLAQDPEEGPWQSLSELWSAYASERARGLSPLSCAVRVAARGDRLGQAFAVGYPAALEHLVPGVRLPCALCATETGGNAPRAITTTLEAVGAGYRLDGTKSFITFGTLAQSLIIVARAGQKPDGRPDIAVVQIPANRAGVSLRELPATPFVPEIVHAHLELDGVEVRESERLPGDGYLRYVKPFRTIEDIHVVGATLGYVLGWNRRVRLEGSLVAELSASLAALELLRSAAPLDPRAHVALQGVYQQVTRTLGSETFASHLEASEPAERERWHRDRALLEVAAQARATRFERAIEDLG